MIPILSLWLPILVAAILVFIVSSILHMVFKYHHKEFRQLPEEESTLEALRQAGVTPGLYHFPHCATMKEMGSPDMLEKYERGPVGLLTVMPSGTPAMPKLLTLWFLYSLLVGVFVAYVTGRTLGADAEYLAVFRLAGTIAFMTYGLSQLVDSIWKGAPWSATAKGVSDGLLYALVTAGTFGWLWS
ncbi:MAG: hypothetical protein O7A98_00320 [Acidobacteria bacterium]|nr:hypothetical protein [Acidobacteriota bacterium]